VTRPLALLAVLLSATGEPLGQSAPAPANPPAAEPTKKPAPAFTDEDLARYRDERLRRESTAAEPAAPAAPAPSMAPVPLLPATRPAGSVEIRDLNGTLPAATRAAAEAAGRRFVAFFALALDEPLVIPLRHFPDAAAYRDHLERNVDSRMSWIGYYDPRKREIVVGPAEDTLSVLRHEIHHFVFDTAFDEAPVWLREGLAEYFETASPTPDGYSVADQPRHRRELALWLEGRREPDLRQLLALNTSLWTEHEVAGSARVRALSWSVVAFLMSSAPGRKAIHDFLASLQDQRGLYSLAAFDRSFPGGAAAFQRQWLEYVEARACVVECAPP
jgi:hypothetical protein